MNTSPSVLLQHPYPHVLGIALCCFPIPSAYDGSALGLCPSSRCEGLAAPEPLRISSGTAATLSSHQTKKPSCPVVK